MQPSSQQEFSALLSPSPSSFPSSSPSPFLSSSSVPVKSTQNVRRSSVRTDLHKAFHLLRRSSTTKAFMLTPPTPSDDLNLLASERPSFIISTEEDQLGSLPGKIALRYLGIPAFADIQGLSGGLVVTTYVKRTHPLHDPSVMSDLRVGRYVRDNATGEWCIITRNNSDGILRLQYMHVNTDGVRERIGFTCSINLFDRGDFVDSVLYKCHDLELKVCHRCACSRCLCRAPPSTAQISAPLGLDAVAQNVIREGAGEWVGTVRVTVVSQISNNPLLLNIDDTMTVRSSYKPSLDNNISSHMQHIAILDTISRSMNIPAPLTSAEEDEGEQRQLDHKQHQQHQFSTNDDAVVPNCDLSQAATLEVRPSSASISNIPTTPPSVPPPALTLPLTPPPLSPVLTVNESRPNCEEASNGEENAHTSPIADSDMPFGELTFENVFSHDGGEVADHFLIATEPTIRNFCEEEEEFAMLPADPSTLPGGIETCMDGMDVEHNYNYYEDDCFSLMTSDRDTRSMTSALSTAGSDYAPQVDSVPLPGDDFVDAISALHLSSPHPNAMVKARDGDTDKTTAKTTKTNLHEHSRRNSHVEKVHDGRHWMEEEDDNDADDETSSVNNHHATEKENQKLPLESNVRYMSPINAAMSETTTRSSKSGVSVAVEDSGTKSAKPEVKTHAEVEMEMVEEDDEEDDSSSFKEQNAMVQIHKSAVSTPTPTQAKSEAKAEAQPPVVVVQPQLQKVQPMQVYVHTHTPTIVQAQPQVVPQQVAAHVQSQPHLAPQAPNLIQGQPQARSQVETQSNQVNSGHGVGQGQGIAVAPIPTMYGGYGYGAYPVAIGAPGATAGVPAANPMMGGMAMSYGQGGGQMGMMMNANVGDMNVNHMNAVSAPRLAPRPQGVSVGGSVGSGAGGLGVSMNMGMGMVGWGLHGQQVMLKARLDAIEKERKAEERRKKNRQAAARSNARKKDLMDGIKAEIQKAKQHEEMLRRRQGLLRHENEILRQQVVKNTR